MDKKRNSEKIELCLCAKCARQFYQTHPRNIRRADPVQVVREECDYCRMGRGYDFILAFPARETRIR